MADGASAEACRECGKPLTDAESAREGVYCHWCHACIQDAFADMASFRIASSDDGANR